VCPQAGVQTPACATPSALPECSRIVSTHRTRLRFWERCRPGGGFGFNLQLVPKGTSRRELQLNTPAGRQRSQATDRRSRETAEGRVDARPEAEVIGDIRAKFYARHQTTPLCLFYRTNPFPGAKSRATTASLTSTAFPTPLPRGR